jgi:hypothetical protein
MEHALQKATRFVLAVPPILDPDGVEVLRFISEPFDALELPDSIISSSAFDETLPVANLTDILPKSVSREIPLQSKAIKVEFSELLIKTFGKIRPFGMSSLTIDFGLDDCREDATNYEQQVDFLKSLAPHLYRNEVKTRLPVRVPRVSEAPATRVPDFIRDSMCGLFRVELNVHPHEILNSPPLDHIAEFRFLMDSIAFVYEPEAGNFLVEKLLSPWFGALNDILFEGDIVFKPLVSTWESLDDAVDGLIDLIKSDSNPKSTQPHA